MSPFLEYESSATRRALREGLAYMLVLRCFVGYFVASALTLPFLNALWLGELPLLAVVQLPKIGLAGWLRTQVVMVVIRALGLSRGSFSPDYIMARPYALVIAYLIPLGIILGVVWVRTRMEKPYRWWVWVLLIMAGVDFGLTLYFAGGPGLTIY
jgi:hypothetical protein